MQWQQDILGGDFESHSFVAAGPDGVERTATLVRLRPGPECGSAGKQRRAVLFLHGWSDYFFNPDLAAFWASAGYDFYALDMHN
ncbi:MAG: alpha/beta hydrolase, partial [Actinomycetes bacterium]